MQKITIRKHVLPVGALAGLALSPLALAQSNVEIYGSLMPTLDRVETSDATEGVPANRATQVAPARFTGIDHPARNRMNSGTSHIGFRGSEDLGNGLKAIFQIESNANIDGDGPPRGPSPTFASRDSYVGLTGAWGLVLIGQKDTPYKWARYPLTSIRGGNFSDGIVNILGNPGFNVLQTVTAGERLNNNFDASFDRRQGNSIHYWSPKWKGFYTQIAHSVNEGKTSATAAAPSISPDLWSVLLAYENGPIMLRYGYERHDDYFGLSQLGGSAGASATNTSSRDDAHRIIGVYNFGKTRVGVAIERLEYENDDSAAGAVDRYKRNGYALVADHRFGSHKIWGTYAKAQSGDCSANGVACSTSGLGADSWAAVYVYSLSKRTELFTMYVKVRNDRSAAYGILPNVGVVAPGADTSGFNLGIFHSF